MFIQHKCTKNNLKAKKGSWYIFAVPKKQEVLEESGIVCVATTNLFFIKDTSYSMSTGLKHPKNRETVPEKFQNQCMVKSMYMFSLNERG